MTNPTDPAFPQKEPIAFTTKQLHEKYPEISSAIGVSTQIAKGLSKREYFAGLALQGIIASPRNLALRKDETSDACIVRLSIAYSDALIKELSK